MLNLAETEWFGEDTIKQLLEPLNAFKGIESCTSSCWIFSLLPFSLFLAVNERYACSKLQQSCLFFLIPLKVVEVRTKERPKSIN